MYPQEQECEALECEYPIPVRDEGDGYPLLPQLTQNPSQRHSPLRYQCSCGNNGPVLKGTVSPD
jgi:hypothetical protein